jgi:predicted transcriptional regulator
MTKQDTTTVFHYGLLLKERRKTHCLSVPQLAKLSGVPYKRITEIETDGKASVREKELIDVAMKRYAYVAVVNTTTEAINEQTDIIACLQKSLLQRLKTRLSEDGYESIKAYLEDIITEASYYGLLISRAGFDERILEHVRKRRTP